MEDLSLFAELTVSEQEKISGGSCYYNGAEYSPGSTSYQAGGLYKCIDGWTIAGGDYWEHV